MSRMQQRVIDLEHEVASVSRGQDSLHTSVEAGAVFNVLDSEGNVTGRLSGDNPALVEYVDGPQPEQPEIPEVVTQPGLINVIVEGQDVHGDEAPLDFKHVIVHMSREPDFEPYDGTAQGVIEQARGSKGFPVHPGTWFVAVQWETLSGKLSPVSEIVEADVDSLVDRDELQEHLDEVRTQLDEKLAEFTPVLEDLDVKLSDLKPGEPSEAVLQDLWAGLAVVDRLVARDAWIGGSMLEDGTIQTRHITVTEELAANIGRFLKISADMIEANVFEGLTFTGNTFQSHHEPQKGVKLDQNGFRAYNSSGDQTVSVDAETGDTVLQNVEARGGSVIGSTITGGYVGTANTGARVYMQGQNLTARDANNAVVSQFGPDGIKLSDPAGQLQSIGPHIYGSHVINWLPNYTDRRTIPAGAPPNEETYGNPVGGTSGLTMTKVSNRYRIRVDFTIDGIAKAAGAETSLIIQGFAYHENRTTEYHRFFSRTIFTGDPMFRIPRMYSVNIESDWTRQAIGTPWKFRWEIKARRFEKASPGLRLLDLDVEITPI